MAINGLGSFDMMSAYNRIGIDRAATTVAPEVQPVSAEQEASKQQSEAKEPELKVNLNLDGMRRRPTSFNLDDIGRDFTKREPFVISQPDEETMQSDVEKAVSDMEKDRSLQQFQYFVGDSNVLVNDEDGMVFVK